MANNVDPAEMAHLDLYCLRRYWYLSVGMKLLIKIVQTMLVCSRMFLLYGVASFPFSL